MNNNHNHTTTTSNKNNDNNNSGFIWHTYTPIKIRGWRESVSKSLKKSEII